MNELMIEELIPSILKHYGLIATEYILERVGSGHIHHTFKLTGKSSFILQRVNKNVFKKPEVIASNLRIVSDYLKVRFPEYDFPSVVKTLNEKEMVYDREGFPWRLFPYLANTFTMDKVSNESEAKSAATEFGRLTRYLDEIDPTLLKPTIPRFHDLNWRYEQLQSSIQRASPERLKTAEYAITKAQHYSYLATDYIDLVHRGVLKLRVTHNDTKINNILFDERTQQAVCVIDLDTLMPGYFIYDLGDMIRTFVSPVDEEEKDLDKISVRKNIYDAIINGYLSQMGAKLSVTEQEYIPYSGMMMTYIMAIRMLADFLNGDIYYHTTYQGQNLRRAENQLKLLEELNKHKFS